MKLVKAEILWTRQCALKCSYCAMATGERNTPTLTQWKKGFVDLKELGCCFAAFYGAEPLADFDKLPETIQFAESIGIHTTVITSGITDHLNDKLQILYEHGLRSITTSFDAYSNDKSSNTKSKVALDTIDIFRSFGPVRDCAAVVTLTKQNYELLPLIIETMTASNVWTFFDIIHPDRKQPGSKVKDTNLDLLFSKKDINDLCEILKKVYFMKEDGYLCHASKPFINLLKSDAANDALYTWNCANEMFPSWITVDCDGSVRPCDDFYIKGLSDIKVWNLSAYFELFTEIWHKQITDMCPGCLWNTHIDAHLIKAGRLPLTDYIHGTGG